MNTVRLSMGMLSLGLMLAMWVGRGLPEAASAQKAQPKWHLVPIPDSWKRRLSWDANRYCSSSCLQFLISVCSQNLFSNLPKL